MGEVYNAYEFVLEMEGERLKAKTKKVKYVPMLSQNAGNVTGLTPALLFGSPIRRLLFLYIILPGQLFHLFFLLSIPTDYLYLDVPWA